MIDDEPEDLVKQYVNIDIKFFIGGMPYQATEEHLKEYFGKYGEVNWALVKRYDASRKWASRGFGFIYLRFHNQDEAD